MIMPTNNRALLPENVGPDGVFSEPARAILSLSISSLFLLFSASLFAAPPACNELEDETRILCEAKAFAAADHRLNERYPKIREKLSASLQKALLEQQRNWLEYRDSMCAMNPSLENPADRVRCLTDLTLSRIDYLEKAWREKAPTGHAGNYDDGFGGSLQIVEKGGQWHFKLEAVRGPTSHVGEFEGVMPPLKDEYHFKSGSGDDVCELQFKKRERGIEVGEVKCSYYHGVRAYFSGIYYRMP